MSRVGAVVIGRNEARNLQRCLSSVQGRAAPVVFVDSGSEDGSVEIARTMGADVIELDRSAPFTVARARNVGLMHIRRQVPEVDLIQFVDGDSEITESWFALAQATLVAERKVAVVCGRTRERFPDKSLYHRLYSVSLDPRVRDPNVCGGMAMMRIEALHGVGAFNSTMVAFEDYELCFRLRRAGWSVRRLDAEMAVHQAAMTRFGQWWQRAVRAGRAGAHAATLHGHLPERYGIREWWSTWLWGLALPAVVICAGPLSEGASVMLLASYPALFYRIYRRARRCGVDARDAALYAANCILAKFPQALGQIRFHAEQLRVPRNGHKTSHAVANRVDPPANKP